MGKIGSRTSARALTALLFALSPLSPVAACFSSSSGSGPASPDLGDSGDGLDSSPIGPADGTLPEAEVDSTADVSPDTHSAPDSAATDEAEAETSLQDDRGSAALDAPVEASDANCTQPTSSTTTNPDGGTYTDYLSSQCTTSTTIALSCRCDEDDVDTCFCGIGNAAPGCVAGSLSDCGYVPTCSADLTSDPQNCGRCGHSCAGMTCTTGQCTSPQLGFGSDPFYPSAWLSDGTNLYASDCGGPGSLISVPVGGLPSTTAPTTLSTGHGEYSLATDGSNLYFLGDSAGTVWSVPASGSTGATLLGTFGQTWNSWGAACGSIHSLSLDANNLYWAVQGPSGNGFVYSMAKGGGPIHVLASDSLVQNGSIAIDATNVYFLAWDDMSNGYVKSVPKNAVGDAGVPSTVVAEFPQQEMLDLLLVGTTLYVAGSAAVYTVPVTGGTPVVFWGNHVNMSVRNLATDGTNLFIDDFANSWVYVKPLAGGYAQRFAGEYEADRVMVDSTSVFYTSYTYAGFWREPITYRP